MIYNYGYILTPQIGKDLMLYDPTFTLQAVLRKAYDIKFSDERITREKGKETLEFTVSNNILGYEHILAENVIEYGGRWFRIKLIEDKSYSSNTTKVTCYALWYEMAEGGNRELKYTNTTIAAVLTSLFSGRNYTFILPPEVQSIQVQSLTSDFNSPLYQLRYILGQYKLEVVFGYNRTDTGVQIVAIPQVKSQTKIEWPLVVGSHISNINRTVDSRNLCTRYLLFGKNSSGGTVTMAHANGGKTYLDDFTWFDSMGYPRRVLEKKKDDQRYSVPIEIRNAAQDYLDIYRAPFISYEADLILYEKTGIPELLHSQLILDDKYRITEWRDVSSREINYSDLFSSNISFNDPRASIIEVLNSQ